MKSVDKKDVALVTRKSRELGDLIAVTKNGRNALVFQRDKYVMPLLRALQTIRKGESVNAGFTDDGRIINVISSTPRNSTEEVLSLVTSANEGMEQSRRNVLSLGRESYVPHMIAALQAHATAAGFVVAELIKDGPTTFIDETDGSVVVKLPTVRQLLRGPVEEHNVRTYGPSDISRVISSGAGITCPTCGHA